MLSKRRHDKGPQRSRGGPRSSELSSSRATKFPQDSKYTDLGQTQGVCVRAAWYDDDSSIDRIGFKHAAYDKYGDKVDAIIRFNSFFVVDNQSNGNGMSQPGSARRPLELPRHCGAFRAKLNAAVQRTLYGPRWPSTARSSARLLSLLH